MGARGAEAEGSPGVAGAALDLSAPVGEDTPARGSAFQAPLFRSRSPVPAPDPCEPESRGLERLLVCQSGFLRTDALDPVRFAGCVSRRPMGRFSTAHRFLKLPFICVYDAFRRSAACGREIVDPSRDGSSHRPGPRNGRLWVG
jgi:hypothetical protein